MFDEPTAVNPEVTALLKAWNHGDSEALEELIPLVMSDLRRMALHHLAKERPEHTLQPTALINEVYLKLAKRSDVNWQDRRHFFATLGTLIRRILVDHARRRSTEKKGGGKVHVSFDEALGRGATLDGAGDREEAIVELDRALGHLAELDPRQVQVVELRYFAGLTIDETAEALAISPMTVKREWKTARLWLLNELGTPSTAGSSADGGPPAGNAVSRARE